MFSEYISAALSRAKYESLEIQLSSYLNPHQGEDVDVSLNKTILKDDGISREEWLSVK